MIKGRQRHNELRATSTPGNKRGTNIIRKGAPGKIAKEIKRGIDKYANQHAQHNNKLMCTHMPETRTSTEITIDNKDT